MIVPSVGVGRWLQRRDAAGTASAPGCDRVRRSLAVADHAQSMRDLPERSPFEPERVRWLLLELLGQLPDRPEFELVRRGCAQRARSRGCRSPTRWLRTSNVISPIGATGSSAGSAATGRAANGRSACTSRGSDGCGGASRAAARRAGRASVRAIRAPAPADDGFAGGALGAAGVALFGAVDLSPEQFAMFGRLASSIDVSMFAIDPCRELWSDMLDTRPLARVREERPDLAWLYDSEPAVLGAWGRAQRDLVAQLLSLEERFEVLAAGAGRDEGRRRRRTGASDRHAAGASGCGAAALRPAVDPPQRGDDPSRLHATHGLIRQAEVLHDCLLDCFEEIDGWRPEDVVVFCADVDAAAAAIEAVFAGVSDARRIPFEVSGRRAAAHPLVAAALELLSIAEGGMRLSAVCDWLRNPAAIAALGLDAPQAGELVGWLDEAGVRWGLDARDGPVKHHWQAAIDRLLLGAAVGEVDSVGEVAPVAGAQALAAQLGACSRCSMRSPTLRARPRAAAVEDWCAAVPTLPGDVRCGARQRRRACRAARRSGRAARARRGHARVGLSPAFDTRSPRSWSAARPQRWLPGRSASARSVDCVAFRFASSACSAWTRPRFHAAARARRARPDAARAALRGSCRPHRRPRRVPRCPSRRARPGAGLLPGSDARDGSVRNPSTVVSELVDYVTARLAPAAAGGSFELVRRRYPDRAGPPALRASAAPVLGAQLRRRRQPCARVGGDGARWLALGRAGHRHRRPDRPRATPMRPMRRGEPAGQRPRRTSRRRSGVRDALAEPARPGCGSARSAPAARAQALEEDEPLW